METSTASAEIDTIRSGVSHTIEVNVENLVLTGSGQINGSGNASNNRMTGNDGSNILDGKIGVDTLSGGAGNDIYLVDSSADVVRETSTVETEIDLVKSPVSRNLGSNLEDLILTGTSSVNGGGNDRPNHITGNAAANILRGKVNNDTLLGLK